MLGQPGDQVQTTIRHDGNGIELRFVGYGDAGTAVGYGAPVFIERYGGELKVHLFPDINNEEVTTISLEGALESNRKAQGYDTPE